jgi:hypothetical protein
MDVRNPDPVAASAPRIDKKAAGPRYRLLGDHYIADQLLPAGVVIGDGTSYPYVSADGEPVPPSQQMEPLNAAAEAEVKKLGERTGNPVDSLPIRGA